MNYLFLCSKSETFICLIVLALRVFKLEICHSFFLTFKKFTSLSKDLSLSLSTSFYLHVLKFFSFLSQVLEKGRGERKRADLRSGVQSKYLTAGVINLSFRLHDCSKLSSVPPTGSWRSDRAGCWSACALVDRDRVLRGDPVVRRSRAFRCWGCALGTPTL